MCRAWRDAVGSWEQVSQICAAYPARYNFAASIARTGIRPLSTTMAGTLSRGSSTTNQRPMHKRVPAMTRHRVLMVMSTIGHNSRRDFAAEKVPVFDRRIIEVRRMVSRAHHVVNYLHTR